MPSRNIIDFLLAHNREAVEEYAQPDAALWRRQYRAKHPTAIAALKCMDGRLNLPVMSNIPMGIIQPFRNIGGKFDLGWPFFGLLLERWVEDAIDHGHDAVILVTYHYAAGDTHRGCAGWGYDTDAARTDAEKIKAQCERVFGSRHMAATPIVLGIETDEDAFIIHGDNGKICNLANETDSSETEISAKLRSLFPQMKRGVIEDLLPLMMGNLAHIKKIRSERRTPTESGHMEQIMGIGRGFDWLHLHNKALLIGPFSYDLKEPIAKAAGILLNNLESGRIRKEDGAVVMISAPYLDETGTGRTMAIEKARSLYQLARTTIEERVPELVPYVQYLVGILDSASRAYIQIPAERETTDAEK